MGNEPSTIDYIKHIGASEFDLYIRWMELDEQVSILCVREYGSFAISVTHLIYMEMWYFLTGFFINVLGLTKYSTASATTSGKSFPQ